MSETYSEDDAVLQARLSILEAEKVAKHVQEWVIIADRWMALAELLRKLSKMAFNRCSAETG